MKKYACIELTYWIQPTILSCYNNWFYLSLSHIKRHSFLKKQLTCNLFQVHKRKKQACYLPSALSSDGPVRRPHRANKKNDSKGKMSFRWTVGGGVGWENTRELTHRRSVFHFRKEVFTIVPPCHWQSWKSALRTLTPCANSDQKNILIRRVLKRLTKTIYNFQPQAVYYYNFKRAWFNNGNGWNTNTNQQDCYWCRLPIIIVCTYKTEPKSAKSSLAQGSNIFWTQN